MNEDEKDERAMLRVLRRVRRPTRLPSTWTATVRAR